MSKPTPSNMALPPANSWEQIHQGKDWPTQTNGWFLKFYVQHYRGTTGLTFLDLGCGTGAQTLFLASRGHKVTALDISKTALERLQKHLPSDQAKGVTTICCDAVKYRPDPNTFDCVVEASLFECLPLEDTMLIMWQIWRCLKPGGRFFARISADELPLEWLKNGAYHGPKTGEELKEMLRGFNGQAKIEETVIECCPDQPIKHWIVDAVKGV